MFDTLDPVFEIRLGGNIETTIETTPEAMKAWLYESCVGGFDVHVSIRPPHASLNTNTMLASISSETLDVRASFAEEEDAILFKLRWV